MAAVKQKVGAIQFVTEQTPELCMAAAEQRERAGTAGRGRRNCGRVAIASPIGPSQGDMVR